MKQLFKKAYSLLFLSLLIVSCNQPGETNTTQATQQDKPDTVVQAENSAPSAGTIHDKEILLNEKLVIEGNILAKARKLNTAEKKALSISVLDSTASASESPYTYHLLDTLYSSSELKVVLIGRAYTEENEIWAASYDRNGTLIDQQLVYYDNSEGALSITSAIKGKAINVKTLNEYAEVEAEKQLTEVYIIDEQGKFIKQK